MEGSKYHAMGPYPPCENPMAPWKNLHPCPTMVVSSKQNRKARVTLSTFLIFITEIIKTLYYQGTGSGENQYLWTLSQLKTGPVITLEKSLYHSVPRFPHLQGESSRAVTHPTLLTSQAFIF